MGKTIYQEFDISKFLFSPELPSLPEKLPKLISHIISRVPGYMREAAANALFPALSNELHQDVTFTYLDGRSFHPNCCEITVADSGVGKGFLDKMCECVSHFAAEANKETEAKLIEWAKACNTAKANAAKPPRPELPLLNPEPDMTNPAFILNAMAAEKACKSVYMNIPELDMLDRLSGGHKQVGQIIRKNFDAAKHGATRATAAGITGKATICLKFNASCVPDVAAQFFKDGIINGTLGRLGVCFTPRSHKKTSGIVKQGKYDEKYMEQLDGYLITLQNIHGEVQSPPKLGALIRELGEEFEEITELSDDSTFESIWHRSLIIGWIKGMVIYCADGRQMRKETLDFVRWAILTDIWSKVQVFSTQSSYNRKSVVAGSRRNGPVSLLEKLPADVFTKADLENLRTDTGKDPYCETQLANWLKRGYIIRLEDGRYQKTEVFFAKHPRQS